MNDKQNTNAEKNLDLNLTKLNLTDLNLDDVQIVSEDDSYALAEGGASYSPAASCSIVIKTR